MVAAEPATFGALLARYEKEEMPARHSTRTAYQSNINNHIRPRWADVPLGAVKPMAVESWLKALPLAPKTRANIRGLMHSIFNCAERWELIAKNPIALVRVKDGSKRRGRPVVLTVEEFHSVLLQLPSPYRTMALVAGCLGLRISEIVGLQWDDFDFDASTLLVQRSIVHGRVDNVKTEYSCDFVPLDPVLATALIQHRGSGCYPTAAGWVFANPRTGRPYHQDTIQQKHIAPAGITAGVGVIGWHTFRHSYRSWLDESGTSITVQKELMRHASIQTTLNVYGRVMTETKRQANSKVVKMVLRGSSQAADPKGAAEAVKTRSAS